jgi:hypothetical protein
LAFVSSGSLVHPRRATILSENRQSFAHFTWLFHSKLSNSKPTIGHSAILLADIPQFGVEFLGQIKALI